MNFTLFSYHVGLFYSTQEKVHFCKEQTLRKGSAKVQFMEHLNSGIIEVNLAFQKGKGHLGRKLMYELADLAGISLFRTSPWCIRMFFILAIYMPLSSAIQ